MQILFILYGGESDIVGFEYSLNLGIILFLFLTSQLEPFFIYTYIFAGSKNQQRITSIFIININTVAPHASRISNSLFCFFYVSSISLSEFGFIIIWKNYIIKDSCWLHYFNDEFFLGEK